MALHPLTFEYFEPTDEQKATMQQARDIFGDAAAKLDPLLPDGPDKTYLMRKLREVAMWANIAITRQADGTPRS